MIKSVKYAGSRYDTAAAIFLVIVTIFRLCYAGTHELLQDETYYWQWSRHLDWGYYDNTPLIAPTIRIFTSLFGTNELGVRAGAVFCSLAVSVFLYLIARRLCDPTVAFVSLILTSIIPLFAAGSMLMTQDPVQLALWGATLYIVLFALDGPGWLWFAAGLFAGLTAMAKLNGWLVVPSVFLFLLVNPEYRKKWLVRPEPYLGGMIALLVFLPFIWWNHTHQNAFWLHIHSMGTRSTAKDGILKWFGRFLGDQTLEMSPVLLAILLFRFFTPLRKITPETRLSSLFLWATSITVFGATALLSLSSKVEGNWAAACYFTGTILVGEQLVRFWRSRNVALRALVILACSFSFILSVGGLYPEVFYRAGMKFSHPKDDRTNELYGWKELADRVDAERSAMGGNPFVFGMNYRIPSELSFYMQGHPFVYSIYLGERTNEYMFWENAASLVGQNGVYVHDNDTPDHQDRLAKVFQRVEVQAPLLIYRDPPYGRHPVRIIQIYRCYGFRGYDLSKWQAGW